MLKNIVHGALLKAERFAGRFSRNRSKTRHVDPYIGYATPTHFVARGRVLSRRRTAPARPGQSRLANLRGMISLFMTDEAAGAEVRSEHGRTVTDEEGYFQLTFPKTTQTGWIERAVTVEGAEAPASCPICVPRADAQYLVISDIDDTVLRTRAYALWRNLITSFTGNVLTRRIFPDAVRLMQRLSRSGQNPIFYVSSSPWNMHAFLDDIFTRADLERGPMFLRDLGLSETKFITEGHGNHKGQSIDRILQANPNLPVVLIGDTGQEDATIYREAADRHPDRIAAIVLRHADPDPGPRELANLERLQRLPLPAFVAARFDEIEERLLQELAKVEIKAPVGLVSV
ncbi:phosphatase domain-containing protein [Roseobacter weihaiensis]|uniref:phosphatase domain-containing protein n=1 Tax=Roseobacter weihaiensis TaxID=2763262 RepID=UPI001D0A46B1|nr:phosphatase domain-containing protein [Roseobacter sp. H9]